MAVPESCRGVQAGQAEAFIAAREGLALFCRDLIARATWSDLGRRALEDMGENPDALLVHTMSDGDCLDMACTLLSVSVALYDADE